VQKILSWRHTGFNVHTKVRTTTKREAERVDKYMIRPILSLERLSFNKQEGQVMIRYYGFCANAHRGKMSKVGVSPSHPPIIEEEERFVPSKGWAEMIRKVYEVDPLLFPNVLVR